MPQAASNERILTTLDHARLKRLMAPRLLTPLAEVLEGPELVPPREVPPDVITMYSQVAMVSLETGMSHRLTLCYPADAEPALGFVSVLSPVGTALLGLRIGDVACWQTPLRETCTARISALLFQPEASGDYVT